MKNVTTIVMCSLLIALGLIARSDGQQGPGAGPPSPGIALPAEQQATQGQASGLSGPGAVPNPRAGAANKMTDQNAVPSRNANPAPSPGVIQSKAGATQPIYNNSAASGQPGTAIDAEGAAPATSPTGNVGQQRGQMGVWLVDSEGPGVRIGRLTDGSAAARAGLRMGDIVLQVNGRGASSPEAVASFIRTIPIGQAATVTIWRDGQQQDLQVTMEPARESHQVGFRGERDGATGGDVNARLARLERQLTAVTEQLQQLQQEMSHLRGSGAPGVGAGERTTQRTPPGTSFNGTPADEFKGAPDAKTGDRSTTPPNGSPPQNPGTSDDLFGTGPSNTK